MQGAGGAFRLVGLELLLGTFVLMWAAMLVWRVVGRGHYRAALWVLFPLTMALALTLPGGLKPSGIAGGLLFFMFLLAVYSQRPMLEWAGGASASALALWLLAEAGARSCGGCPVGAVHALVGAFFVGAVTHGMVLGHWYLNQPRLPIEPLKGAAAIVLLSVAASLVAGVVSYRKLMQAEVTAGIFALAASPR
ncbi:MAG: hypothetical protein ACRDIF_07745, partial [Actinomycetota bacterium]